MEGVNFDWRVILRVVKVNLRDISYGLRKFKMMGANDLSVLQDLNCPILPVREKLPRLIAWKPLDMGFIKLNVDGGSWGNPGRSGGGGILQDYRGKVIRVLLTFMVMRRVLLPSAVLFLMVFVCVIHLV